MPGLLRLCVLALVAAVGITAPASASRKEHLRRALLTSPTDVYSVNFFNEMKVPLNATFTFTKGATPGVLVEKKLVPPNSNFTSGPYDYTEGTANFRYVLQTVKVKYWPAGGGYADQEGALVEAPFEGVSGVTPVIEMYVKPKPNDPTGEHVGSLTVTKPASG